MRSDRKPRNDVEQQAPGSSSHSVRLQCPDPDEFAQALNFFGAEVHQTGRGPFRGGIHLLRMGAVTIARFSVNRAIHARGVKPDTYGLVLFAEGNRSVRLQGRPFRPGMIAAIGPPGEWQHVSAAPTSQHLDVAVDAAVLRRSAQVLHKVDLEDRLGSFRAMRPDPDAFRALRAFLDRLFSATQTAANPRFDRDHLRDVEQRCLELLLSAVLSGELAMDEPRRIGKLTLVANRAVEFMRANLDQRLLTADLCRELGVSSRTLRYAFEEQFGVSPMAYFKARKLAAVRRQLRSAGCGSVHVHEVARQLGLGHTGNFAADYRRQFGELPSETVGTY